MGGRTIHAVVVAGILGMMAGLGSPAPGAWVALAPEAEQGEPQLAVKDISREGMDVALSIPGIQRDEVEIGGEVYQQFTIPGGIETDEVGYPSLPAITRLVAIPGQGGAEVRVISIDSLVFEGVEIPPVAPWAIDGCDAEDPYWDPEVYGRDAFYPSSAAALGEPVIMRDLRLAQLVIYPVRYNPVRRELRVYQNVEVEVVFTDEGTNEKEMRRHRPSASFEQLYRSLVLNYDELGRGTDGVERGSYLIITHDQFIEEIAPLAEWKQRKGWDVVVTPLSVIGSSPSATDIKNYISDAYFTWDIPPEYVLLVGDVSMGSIGGFPTFTYSNNCTDLPFTLLEGDDYFPEMLISRISIDSENEANVVVAKTLGYERDPYMGSTAWYRRGLVVASTNAAISCKWTKRWVRDKMLENGFAQVDSVWYPPTLGPEQIQAFINQGVSFVNYRGWAGANGWYYPSFTVSNIGQLTNGWKQPIMTSIICNTGDFANNIDPCFGEAWVRYGTTSNPKGGPAFFGPSEYNTHTKWNNSIDSGIYWGIFDEGLLEFAQAMHRGKIEMYNNFPNHIGPGGSVAFYFHVYNALGDPELNMWTTVPRDMAVDHVASIPLGTNYVVVAAEVEGLPAEGALVCLYKEGEVFARELVGSSGSVVLTFEAGTTGDLLVTVTRVNCEPYLGSVSITQANRFVGYNSHTIDDDNVGGSQGNGDEHVNPGETIEMPTVVRNWGMESASSVTGYLTSDDPWVTIIDGEESFGTIGPGSTAQSLEDFDFQVSTACTSGHVLQFTLRANSGGEDYYTLVEIPVRGPDLVYSDHSIIDGGSVAGNGILDPGETANLVVTLENQGLAGVTGVQATLAGTDLWFTIEDAVGSFGDVGPGATASNSSDPFTLTADPLLRDGYDGYFTLEITGDGGYETSVPLEIDVGTTGTTDPMGPDEYGYYAYDNTDASYDEAPDYGWYEIDPNYGGSGTPISLGEDDVDTLSLPFTFTYYGRQYDKISVCSNGFAALGETWVMIPRNWGIPAALGPDAMLAPFWDELKMSTGGIYYYHDTSNHRFVIEWSRVRNEYGSEPQETFQILLYDPVHHETATGDGEIVFQYQTVYNIDSSENYATVGIEEPDQWYGLEYTYANHYPPEAASLAAGRAIKFTTNSPHSPAIGLELDPDATVYHRGETLGYTAYVTNNTSYSQSVVGRADVTLPNGNPYPGNPVIGPKSVTLSSGQSAHPHFTHFIPQAAPLGTYTYTVTIEDGQGNVVAEDSFIFGVLP